MTTRVGWLVCVLALFGWFSAVAQGQSTQSGSNENDIGIPDGGSAVSTIVLGGAPAGATITGVDVYFRIVHTFSADLEVEVCTDVGGCPVLWYNEGGSSDDPTRTVSGITLFNGLAADRSWDLLVYDDYPGDVGFIDEWSITVHYVAPPGPGSFTLSSESPTCGGSPGYPAPEVALGWTASANALSYSVYRDGALLADGLGDLSYVDGSGLVPGQTYGYVVRAVNESGNEDSNEVVVYIPASLCESQDPPGSFTLASQAPYCDADTEPERPSVRLQWTESPGADSYDLFRNGGLVAAGVNGTAFVDATVAAGQSYVYYSRARNEAGARDSNQVVVEIAAAICAPVEYELGPEEAPVPAVVEPEAPRVVYGPEGQKAMVWFQLGAGGTIICVQLFDAEGRALTAPLRVDQTPGVNRTPSATYDPDGNLLVFWTHDADAAAIEPAGRVAAGAMSGSSVLGRKFDPSGAPVGNESSVSSGGPEGTEAPESSADRSGRTIVVWNDGGWIRARRLDAGGSSIGPQMTANDAPGGSHPRIGISASGEFVLVWKETLGASTGIVLRRYDESGNAVGVIRAATDSPAAEHPAIAMDDAGNFTVAWDDFGDGRDVFAQRFFPNSTPRGARYRANVESAGDQTNPRVSMNGKGKAAIVWQSSEPGAATGGSGGTVRGRTYSDIGAAEAGDLEIAAAENGNEPKAPDVSLDDNDDMTVVYERRGPGNRPEGVFRREIDASAPAGECVSDATSLCLSQGRFRVTTLWEDSVSSDAFAGQSVALTGDTGYFWFFGSENVEVVVKVLDACSINDRYWVFAAGLTDVEVTLRIDDVVSGASVTYFSNRGQAFLPILDVDAFATCGEAADSQLALDYQHVLGARELMALVSWLQAEDAPLPVPSSAATQSVSAGGATCTAESDALCVTGERYRVEVDFETATGASGRGQAVRLTSDTGYFWFFDEENVEIVVKVLNACGLNQRTWVFAAGLTDVEARLVVTDTLTGAQRIYSNPRGTPFLPIQDTDAFSTCP